MNKKFEYVDDNPGAYFGMLVENWEELNESLGLSNQDKNELVNAIEKARKINKESDAGITNKVYVDFGTYGMKLSKIVGRKEHRKFVNAWRDKSTDDIIKELSSQDWEINESLKESVSKSDLYSALEYMYGFNKKEANDWIKKASDKMKQSVVDGWKGNAKKSALTDSLKEDKFVPKDKMSKKAQKELNDKKRGTWGNTNPVTRVQPNKKAYDRKRDKKVVEESFDNDVNVLVNLLSDKYCDEDGIVTKDSYDSVYKYLGKKYSEKIRDAVMDNLVTEFGLPAERDKKVVDEAKETFSSLSELADKIDKLSAVSMAYEDDGKIKIKGRWRKSTRQSNNDYVSINSSLKKLLGDKKYKLVFENIDSRDGGKEFSAQLSFTVPKVVVESLTEDS